MPQNKSGAKKEKREKIIGRILISSSEESINLTNSDSDYIPPTSGKEPAEEYSEGSAVVESPLDQTPEKEVKKSKQKMSRKSTHESNQNAPSSDESGPIIESPTNNLRSTTQDGSSHLPDNSIDQAASAVFKDTAKKSLVKIRNILERRMKKKALIEKLERSLEKKEPPSYLAINVKAVVTPMYQTQTDTTVNNAIWECQSIIINHLITVRSDELKDINVELAELKQEYQERCNEYCMKMSESGVPINNVTKNAAKQDFENQLIKIDRKVTHDHILKTMQSNERVDSERKRQAEDEVEKTLGNRPPDAVKRLEKLVLQMSKDLKEMKGKVYAKSENRSKTDRGTPSSIEKPPQKLISKQKKQKRKKLLDLNAQALSEKETDPGRKNGKTVPRKNGESRSKQNRKRVARNAEDPVEVLEI